MGMESVMGDRVGSSGSNGSNGSSGRGRERERERERERGTVRSRTEEERTVIALVEESGWDLTGGTQLAH
jgi:hypothetical protein